MTRRLHDVRFSTPAVERARARAEERERARHHGDTGRVHGDQIDLAVLVDEVDQGPVEVREDLPTAWVSALVDDKSDIKWRGEAPGRLDVTLDRESAFVRLKGKAHFALQHPCVRCGQRDVPFDVPLKIDLRLVERTGDEAPEGDLEQFDDGDDHAGSPLGDAADLEDIDVASYRGHAVALDTILREQLFLELPAHPNCESAGACLKGPCGLVEQQEALQAEQERFIDPRWEALLALKAKLGDGATGPATPSPAILTPKKAPATTTMPNVTTAPATQMATAKKAPAKKTAKKAPAKKTTKKAPTKKAPAKKTAKKAPAKKTAKKAPAKKAAKKAPAKKAAKKAPAKKTVKKTAKKAPAKKTAKKTTKKKR